jgi:hypothetical protein
LFFLSLSTQILWHPMLFPTPSMEVTSFRAHYSLFLKRISFVI